MGIIGTFLLLVTRSSCHRTDNLFLIFNFRVHLQEHRTPVLYTINNLNEGCQFPCMSLENFNFRV